MENRRWEESEKIREEKESEERRCRCAKRSKSRETLFFHWFVAPEGRKVGSLKRRVRSHLGRWEMKNCAALWREAHFQVRCRKDTKTGAFFKVEMFTKGTTLWREVQKQIDRWMDNCNYITLQPQLQLQLPLQLPWSKTTNTSTTATTTTTTTITTTTVPQLHCSCSCNYNCNYNCSCNFNCATATLQTQ